MDKRRFPLPTDDTKVYSPKVVIPVGEQYVLTDNYTAKDGNVYNRSDEDALLGRERVNENHK